MHQAVQPSCAIGRAGYVGNKCTLVSSVFSRIYHSLHVVTAVLALTPPMIYCSAGIGNDDVRHIKLKPGGSRTGRCLLRPRLWAVNFPLPPADFGSPDIYRYPHSTWDTHASALSQASFVLKNHHRFSSLLVLHAQPLVMTTASPRT